MSWWDGRMCAFDLETTAPDPEEARIVTAAVAFVGGGEPTETRTWLADPGVEIPEGATEVHGITTEQAQAEGRPVDEVVGEVLLALGEAIIAGWPLIIFNARYDLTVVDREARRHGEGLAPDWTGLLVVDPFVCDKHLHRYRKSYPGRMTPEEAKAAGIPSSRTLEGMCAHYGATLDGAHDAAFDAIAAGRLAWCIGKRGEVVRRVRGKQEAIELAALKREWEAVRGDLPALHAAQTRWALAERDRFEAYKRSQGDHEEADRIAAEKGWPVLELPSEVAA